MGLPKYWWDSPINVKYWWDKVPPSHPRLRPCRNFVNKLYLVCWNVISSNVTDIMWIISYKYEIECPYSGKFPLKLHTLWMFYWRDIVSSCQMIVQIDGVGLYSIWYIEDIWSSFFAASWAPLWLMGNHTSNRYSIPRILLKNYPQFNKRSFSEIWNIDETYAL